MATPIGTLGTIQTITVGNNVFTDLTNLIVLRCSWSANVVGRYSTCRRANAATNATAGYQVTAGKTFKIFAVRVMAWGGTANSTLNIGYSDNDCGGDSATAPTNYTPPQSNPGGGELYVITPSSTVGTIEHPWQWSIPAGKYLTFQNNNAGTRHIIDVYGYEV